MDRVILAVFLALGAIVVIAVKAPPKVYENVKTYYKTLIQAPAAQVNAYSNRVVRKPVKPPVAQPAAKTARTQGSGPQITVLGGIWERESHASRARTTPPASETETSAATQEPTAVAPQDVPAQEHVASTSEEPLPQAQ